GASGTLEPSTPATRRSTDERDHLADARARQRPGARPTSATTLPTPDITLPTRPARPRSMGRTRSRSVGSALWRMMDYGPLLRPIPSETHLHLALCARCRANSASWLTAPPDDRQCHRPRLGH